MRVDYSARSGGIIEMILRFSFNMKACCVFSFESPHRGDSNEYTQQAIINIKIRKLSQRSCLQLWDFSLGTPERVRNSRGKPAISVRAIEVLLYFGTRKLTLRYQWFGIKGVEM